jgi:hypothetical protein
MTNELNNNKQDQAENTKTEEVKKIMLFLSSNSYYYTTTIENFQKLIDSLGQIGKKFSVEIVDAEKNPELAEKYNVLVEPTLIIGDKYFVGRFEDKRVANYMKSYFKNIL